MPIELATAVPLASQGKVLNYKTLYPEDFVAEGYVFNSGDDSPAVQACIDAAYAAGGNVNIQMPPDVYLNSVPRTDRNGNASVALPPAHDGIVMTLRFHAADGGTIFHTTLSGQSYSSSFGPPSLIGGPTKEQTGTGPHVQFSGAAIEWLGHFEVNLGADPTICGIDMGGVSKTKVEDIEIRGSFTVQPTHAWAFGIRFPEGDNAGQVDIGRIFSAYQTVGVVGNSAHITADSIRTYKCVGGLALTGNQQFAGNDGHSSVILKLNTEWCVHHICSWDPTTGPISPPPNTPSQIVIALWDIEDALPSNWYSTSEHLLDANNQIYGAANLARVLQNTGRVKGFTFTGGANFLPTDLNAGPTTKSGHFGDGFDGAAVLDGTATVPWASKAGSIYTMTRNCYCTTLTVNAGVTLITHGYQRFATISVVDLGTIQDLGGAGAANGTAGSATAAGIYGVSGAGGAGNTGAGSAGTNTTSFGHGKGAAGGAGSSGAAGAAGTVTGDGITSVYRNSTPASVGILGFGAVRLLSGTSGGGGGGGDGTNKGGGGGGGAGMHSVFTPSYTLGVTGVINFQGGAGGTPATGNCGGGGGGGGGIFLVYSIMPPSILGTVNVAGGAAGAGVGTGAAGTPGVNGDMLTIPLV